MKIAVLSTEYPIPTHTFIRREILGLERCGIEVERIAIRWPGETPPGEDDRDELTKTFSVLNRGVAALVVDVLLVALTRPVTLLRGLIAAIGFGYHSHAGLFRHLAYLVEACGVLRRVRSEKVEHLHAHFATNATMVALLVKRLGGPPISFTIHGPGEWDAPELLHIPEKVAEASFVTAISDFAKSQTYRWTHPSLWGKVHVVRCGVDSSFLDYPVTPVPDVTRLVNVARLGRSKGHFILIEAAARLAEEGLDFQIKLVGDGELRGLIRDRIHEYGLDDRIELAGWLDGESVRKEIVESRALVLPSFGEGLPVVIMEALALARPVISSRIAGIPELLVDGECGWLVNSGSVDDLVDALRELLTTPTERLSEMGVAGRARVLEKHDAQREAEKLAELLRASRRPAGPATASR